MNDETKPDESAEQPESYFSISFSSEQEGEAFVEFGAHDPGISDKIGHDWHRWVAVKTKVNYKTSLEIRPRVREDGGFHFDILIDKIGSSGDGHGH